MFCLFQEADFAAAPLTVTLSRDEVSNGNLGIWQLLLKVDIELILYYIELHFNNLHCKLTGYRFYISILGRHIYCTCETHSS